ncbi:MAG: hypothetical protein KGM42_10310 [Hyphomicrobiales bacterium]|nr:hypothetical protein [Hyphomicrobiales bacterium]
MNFKVLIHSSISRFLAGSNGSVALAFALAAPVFMSAVGASVDYARLTTAKSEFQSAVDAAALASAAAVRNGLDPSVATSIAQQTLIGNLGNRATIVGSPQVDIQTMGTQNNVTVSVSGNISLLFGKFVGIPNMPVQTSSTAQAITGPTASASWALNLNGAGGVVGDPHFTFTNAAGVGVSFTSPCVGDSWYNVLSDGGVQWNSRCLADGTSLFFEGSQLKIGGHTISYMPYKSSSFSVRPGHVDWYTDDCVSVFSSKLQTGYCGFAQPATLIIDGQTIDPTASPYVGQSIFTPLNDTTNGVVITVQMSAYPIPAYYGAPAAPIANYLAVDIRTPQYEIGLTLPNGFQDAFVAVTNAGMCGTPGGYFGSFVNNAPAPSITPFTISDPSFVGAQYAWTPSCANSGGRIAHLVQ